MSEDFHQTKLLQNISSKALKDLGFIFKCDFFSQTFLFPLNQRCTIEKTLGIPGIWNNQTGSLSSIFHCVSRSKKLFIFLTARIGQNKFFAYFRLLFTLKIGAKIPLK